VERDGDDLLGGLTAGQLELLNLRPFIAEPINQSIFEYCA
jgi:hypothetical protein